MALSIAQQVSRLVSKACERGPRSLRFCCCKLVGAGRLLPEILSRPRVPGRKRESSRRISRTIMKFRLTLCLSVGWMALFTLDETSLSHLRLREGYRARRARTAHPLPNRRELPGRYASPAPFCRVLWLAKGAGSSQQPCERCERCGRQQLESEARHLAVVAMQITKSETRTRSYTRSKTARYHAQETVGSVL